MSRKNFLSKSKSQIMFTFKMIWLSPEKSIKKYFAGWWLVRLSINYCYDYHHHHQYLTITLVFFGCLVFLVKVTLDRLLSLKSFLFRTNIWVVIKFNRFFSWKICLVTILNNENYWSIFKHFVSIDRTSRSQSTNHQHSKCICQCQNGCLPFSFFSYCCLF